MGGIEEQPANRIGRNMNPIPFVMLGLFLIVNPALAQQPSQQLPATTPLPGNRHLTG